MASLKEIFLNSAREKDFCNVNPIHIPDKVSTKAYERKIVVRAVFEMLQESIPHKDWFIGGSAAYMGDLPFGDIDVFFADEEKAKQAIRHIANIHRAGKDLDTGAEVFSAPTSAINLSSFAESFPPEQSAYVTFENMYQNSFMSTNITTKVRGFSDQVTIQLVTKNTGTYEQIFKRIDLNVCKVALLSDGRRIKDEEANYGIRVNKLNHKTISRVVKYVTRMYPDFHREEACLSTLKQTIDSFIENDEPVSTSKEFYAFQHHTDDNSEIPANELLKQQIYDVFDEKSDVIEYFKKQALERAPELLL